MSFEQSLTPQRYGKAKKKPQTLRLTVLGMYLLAVSQGIRTRRKLAEENFQPSVTLTCQTSRICRLASRSNTMYLNCSTFILDLFKITYPTTTAKRSLEYTNRQKTHPKIPGPSNPRVTKNTPHPSIPTSLKKNPTHLVPSSRF